MTENPTQREIHERIAAKRANLPRVDHNGKPTGRPATYTYDERGLLVSVRPSPDSAAGRAIAAQESTE